MALGQAWRPTVVAQIPLKQRLQAGTGRATIKLFSGTANPELAREVAQYLDMELGQVKIKPFSDGEIYVQIQESVRGVDCFLMQPTCSPVNENLMELLILLDAFKRA